MGFFFQYLLIYLFVKSPQAEDVQAIKAYVDSKGKKGKDETRHALENFGWTIKFRYRKDGTKQYSYSTPDGKHSFLSLIAAAKSFLGEGDGEGEGTYLYIIMYSVMFQLFPSKKSYVSFVILFYQF